MRTKQPFLPYLETAPRPWRQYRDEPVMRGLDELDALTRAQLERMREAVRARSGT